jgi:hypothetical protein
MTAEDGKQRLTDVANAETLLRLVQSVPSPKAEPIKRWLAKVGYERMQEMADPARSLERTRETWQKHGRSEKWIQQRMTGQETRNSVCAIANNGRRAGQRSCNPPDSRRRRRIGPTPGLLDNPIPLQQDFGQ